jgi:hypothetical protein
MRKAPLMPPGNPEARTKSQAVDVCIYRFEHILPLSDSSFRFGIVSSRKPTQHGLRFSVVQSAKFGRATGFVALARCFYADSRRLNEMSNPCQSAACHYNGDAVLEGRLLCRDHFHQDAVKKLERYRSRLRKANESDGERAALSKFVSEIISQTTVLVSRSKPLSQEQRDLFLELSWVSLQFDKRLQRNPRQIKDYP